LLAVDFEGDGHVGRDVDSAFGGVTLWIAEDPVPDLRRRYGLCSIGKHGSPWSPDTARQEARRVLGEIAAAA
jgi:hypothetical protein